jgi:hypothetical protein
VFGIDIEACVRCGGKLEVIASMEELEVIAKILRALGTDGAGTVPDRAAAWGTGAARAVLQSCGEAAGHWVCRTGPLSMLGSGSPQGPSRESAMPQGAIELPIRSAQKLSCVPPRSWQLF